MRDRTEWIETVQTGWNTLVDLDVEAVRRALAAPVPADHPALYGDGHAGGARRAGSYTPPLMIDGSETLRIGVAGLGYWGAQPGAQLRRDPRL